MQHNYESDLIRVNLYLQKMYQQILNQKIEESRKNIDENEVIAAKTEISEWLSEEYQKRPAEIGALISVMALECYNYSYDDEDDEIVSLMRECESRQDFLDAVWDNMDILYVLIEHEIDVYEPKGYNYHFTDDILKTPEGREMYEKFHPNYQKEMAYDGFWLRHHDSKSFEVINYPIHNFIEFYLTMMTTLDLFEDSDESCLVISDILETIHHKEAPLADQILKEMLKYYYTLVKTDKIFQKGKSVQTFTRFLEKSSRTEIIDEMWQDDNARYELVQCFASRYRIGLYPETDNQSVKQFCKKMDEKNRRR